MRGRKGVHPLIATVFMILIVVSVATLLGEWIGPFTQEQTDAVEDESDLVQACANIDVQLLDGSYTDTQANVTVINEGSQRVESAELILLSTGLVMETHTFDALEPSGIDSATLDISRTPDRAVVYASECPMKRDETVLE